ncbi:MAG: SDR family oxidoreductase [Amaricoccus sp.]|uniref:SDR family NAD(P)-dependent oxidoreductase n=1 Tax=Amaricoccus sp. TaxID=1872485 RepID=UPI0039E38762
MRADRYGPCRGLSGFGRVAAHDRAGHPGGQWRHHLLSGFPCPPCRAGRHGGEALKNRTALVTGGAGGIGKAIGVALKRDGWDVVLTDLSDNLESAAAEIGADFRHGNVTDREAMRAMVESCDRLGALVNCAGIATLTPFLEMDLAVWQRIMEVNLNAPLHLSQLAARRMAELGGGAIVNITSISGLRAGALRTAYGTSKAALIHLTRQMALELAPLGIRCNGVAPGPVDTELTRGHYDEAARNEYLRAIPQDRFSSTEDIAEAVAFLCSDRAASITGQNLAVDGGYSSAGLGVPTAQGMYHQA